MPTGFWQILGLAATGFALALVIPAGAEFLWEWGSKRNWRILKYSTLFIAAAVWDIWTTICIAGTGYVVWIVITYQGEPCITPACIGD